MKRTTGLKLGLAAAVLMAPFAAIAATQSVTANIAFDTPLTMTKNFDISFGTVAALTAGTYTISPAGVVTPSGGGVVLYGTPQAGDIDIAGSATQAINISVGSYTANNGVTPSAATCSYDGGVAGACSLTAQAAAGAGTNLLVGVQVVADGTQAAATAAAPTFVVTVVYN
jgi:hypothetical protein